MAFKRAILNQAVMKDPIAARIHTILNELLTMHHPPLRAHPNIVKLLGVGFETEGPSDDQRAMPVLIPECAELGNLAEVLETARKEDRPLEFGVKLSLCLDIAHGLKILHACGQLVPFMCSSQAQVASRVHQVSMIFRKLRMPLPYTVPYYLVVFP